MKIVIRQRFTKMSHFNRDGFTFLAAFCILKSTLADFEVLLRVLLAGAMIIYQIKWLMRHILKITACGKFKSRTLCRLKIGFWIKHSNTWISADKVGNVFVDNEYLVPPHTSPFKIRPYFLTTPIFFIFWARPRAYDFFFFQ